MAVTRTARGTAFSKTSGTTLQIAAQSLNIGDLLVVQLAYDDATLSGVAWGSQALTLGDAVIGAGVRTRLAWCVADATASRTIDATWSTAIVAKAMVADSFRSSVTGGGQTWFADVNATNTGVGTAASTAAVDPAKGGTESVAVGVVGTEGPSGDTAGTWVEPNTAGQRTGSTGNPANSNVTVSGAYRLAVAANSTAALSKTGMTSRDWGAAIRYFYWAVPPTTVGDSFIADAIIRNTVEGNFTADAVIRNAVTGSFTADAELAGLPVTTEGGTFTADAIIQRTETASFTLDAEIDEAPPTGPIWTAPANTTTVEDMTPTLEWTMPPTAATDMYFEIQLDTANTFDTGNLRIYRSFPDASGWEFFNGTIWVAMSASGVAVQYAGNAARFTVPSPLTTGTWYRRVRAG